MAIAADHTGQIVVAAIQRRALHHPVIQLV